MTTLRVGFLHIGRERSGLRRYGAMLAAEAATRPELEVVESDIGDGWEDPQVHKDPPEKRLAALRMGANVAAYALTH